MPTKTSRQQYVVLPVRGLRAVTRTSSAPARNFLLSMSTLPNLASLAASAAETRSLGAMLAATPLVSHPEAPQAKMKLLDQVAEDGAKLVEATPQAILALREAQPNLKVVPVVYFEPQVRPPHTIENKIAAAASIKIKLTVVSGANGKPVAGATVVAFTDFANGVGAQGKTNSAGQVSLALGAMSKKLQRLYVYPERNHWGLLKKNVTVTSGQQITLRPVDLTFTDSLRHFYGNSPDNAGVGVRVGVIDTGIDLTHPDLQVSGGLNTVLGEQPSDFGDNGVGHGTHCAGIIGARGVPPTGIRGLAPSVELRSYRVFPRGGGGASNFAIAKAIDRAVADGCDLINMSLGGGDPDDVTRAAMEDALAQGSLIFVAAGNDDRSPVAFPAAASPPAIAVSAMGRKGTFPTGTTQEDTVAAPFGTDKKNFMASFSNIGLEIDLTAPGVGVISTFPGGYAPLDGTSMATPAVTGFAAKLLSGMTSLLGMPRDAARSAATAQAVFAAAKKLGFGPEFEGQGLPR